MNLNPTVLKEVDDYFTRFSKPSKYKVCWRIKYKGQFISLKSRNFWVSKGKAKESIGWFFNTSYLFCPLAGKYKPSNLVDLLEKEGIIELVEVKL